MRPLENRDGPAHMGEFRGFHDYSAFSGLGWEMNEKWVKTL
jgi:hypothetical protein